jgi:RHS repeat-associated protein
VGESPNRPPQVGGWGRPNSGVQVRPTRAWPLRNLTAKTGLYYYRARYYDQNVGRFLSEDRKEIGVLGEWPNLYSYVKNRSTNLIDPFGLFTVKPGVPYPSLEIQALVECIEFKTHLHLLINSTTDSHDPNTPHTNGVAVDLHYDNEMATDSILCAAAGCGAGYGRDEKKNPSPKSTGPHIHLQIPRGTNGGRGDLPLANCHSCER